MEDCKGTTHSSCALVQLDAKKSTKIGIVLPKPDGPLSSVMPRSSIESADVTVTRAMLMASCVTAELR